MKLANFITEKFWILFVLSFILALFFPYFGKALSSLIIPILGIILFLTYLKIDYLEIINHLKKPLFVIYILILYLIIIPICVFILFHFIQPELAIPFLILSAIPPGVASPLFTDLLKGNTSLSTTVSFVAYLIAPFTLIFLLFLTTKTLIHLDIWGLFNTLLLVSFLPLILAQIIRKVNKKLIDTTKKYYSSISVIILTLLVYIVIANQANAILENPLSIIPDTLWLYILFILLHIAGYYGAFWRPKKDKIALGVTKAYMNNALAISIAFTFFTPKIALIMILSEIPWNTLLGGFKLVVNKLK